MSKSFSVIPEIVIPDEGDDIVITPINKNNDKVLGSLNNDDNFSCSHVMWSHTCDPEDFGHALDYLSLCMNPSDAKQYVDNLIDDADEGKLEHYKVVDIFRAAKCEPATDEHAVQLSKQMKAGTKVAPAMLVRGKKGKTISHSLIADGYHRLSAAYIIDPEMITPCVVADK